MVPATPRHGGLTRKKEYFVPFQRSVDRSEGRRDTADAEAAARTLQANTATGEPKTAHGPAEMVRGLHVVRRLAVKVRAQAANQLHALLVTAPEELKAQLRGLSTAKLVTTAARFRPGGLPKDLRAATKLAMRSAARRHQRISEEIAELEKQIARLVSKAVPALASLRGVGTDTAVSLCWSPSEQPREAQERGVLRLSLRRGSRAGFLEHTGAPPPQPRRQPGHQPGPPRAGARADELGGPHPRVRC